MKVIVFCSMWAGLALLLWRTPPRLTPPPRPNILWITCEDMSPHLGCYGDEQVKTPFLDQLATEGVRYSHVYSVAGVCAPSRSALITGMYPMSIGTQHMRTLQPDSFPHKFSPVRTYSAVIPEYVRCFPEYLRLSRTPAQPGYYCTNNEKQDYQFVPPVTVWDESSGKAHWRNRPDGQPFFSVFNLQITHESQIWTREKEPMLIAPERVKVPVYYPDTKTVRHDIARHLSNVMRMDSLVGRLIGQLKADGLYENTIIFFFSDHGDGLPFVKREVYDRGLRVPMIVRIPEQFRVAGRKQPGSIDSQLVSFVDLAPTVLSLAQVPLPGHLQGQAFLGEQKAKTLRKYIFGGRDRMDRPVDRVRTVGDGRFKYYRNYHPEKSYYQPIEFRVRMLMMQELLALRDAGKLNETQMKWFRPTKPTEELCDTQTDPDEFINLADNPAFQNKLIELRRQYEKWLTSVGDQSAQPEADMVNRMWNGALEAPQTALPQVIRSGNTLTIRCATPGASIGYQLAGNIGGWGVYGGNALKLAPGDSLQIVAHRIGYKPSQLSLRIN